MTDMNRLSVHCSHPGKINCIHMHILAGRMATLSAEKSNEKSQVNEYSRQTSAVFCKQSYLQKVI